MFSAAVHLLRIKDLKDLSIFFSRGYYRHAGPKGPEEMFSRERSRGTGPRATGKQRAAVRRARACPSPCLDPNEKWPGAVDNFRADRAIAGDRPPRYGPGTVLLKVRRTLMSIARRPPRPQGP